MAKKLGDLEKKYFRNGHLSRALGSLEDVEDGCLKLAATFILKRKPRPSGARQRLPLPQSQVYLPLKMTFMHICSLTQKTNKKQFMT